MEGFRSFCEFVSVFLEGLVHMKKGFFVGLCVGVFILSFGVIRSAAQEETQGKNSSVFFPEPAYTFVPVFEGVVVPHDFVIQNKGETALDVKQVEGG